MIRPVTQSDAQAICGIYNYYVLNTIVTFEEEEIPAEEMRSRIATVAEKYPWFVYEERGDIKGYTYASPWKARNSYRHSVETTVYLQHGENGKGIGSKLYQALFEALGKQGIHAAIGGIALPNEASVALHEKFGMVKVADFKEVGYKFDRWIDVGYWEKILPQ